MRAPLALAAALAASAAAAQPGVDGLPEARAALGDVTVGTDLVYARRPGFRPLRLDVYAAAGDAPRPLVVFVHGGDWASGDKRMAGLYEPYPETFADLARAGFVVASVEYRLSGEAVFPAAAQDVAAAVGWLLAEENRFGIDPRRIALWGVSAGAHLAAFAALGCDDAVLGEAARPEPCAQAFVGWSGAYDLTTLFGAADPTASDAARALLGCDTACPEARLAEASPLALAGPGDPATLLVHGGADTAAPPGQSMALAARLAAAGAAVETVLIDGAGSGWSAATPAGSGRASRRALADTIGFLSRALRAGP